MIGSAGPAGMAPVSHSTHPTSWEPMLQSPHVKTEPVEDVGYLNQSSGFCSSGFHSASPSPSSKDSNEHSLRSAGSPHEKSPSYDNMSLKAKTILSSSLETYISQMRYDTITPPDRVGNDNREMYPGYDSAYCPRNRAPSSLSSSPITRTTPPKSPRSSPEHNLYDRHNDSAFEEMNSKLNGDDGRELSGGEDLDDEPGLRVPAVNSHGKVKTFKCKQCDFVAVTKLSFWEHSKAHIKPEKQLHCRKCPFVTEYKHHLEYHMRNHTGVKPFQCNKCSYSCVNKSMLNSHLKSHSNIYQYRCANCNYATKYCHSLKLHLRKYDHLPAMVLHPDGTPNPVPIIDVYGTRRGPKQKSLSKYDQTPVNSNGMPQPPPQLYPSHFPIAYLPPLLPHAFMFPPNNNYEHDNCTNQQERPEPHQEKSRTESTSSLLHQRLSLTENAENNKTPPPPPNSPGNTSRTFTADEISEVEVPCDDALDLTNAKTNDVSTPPASPEPQNPVTPTTALKNRRKGRAFKLEPAALRLQHVDEGPKEMDIADSESEASAAIPAQRYACQYCDINFGDLTMHTIHMGYHGYNDPFMCNKCGERSPDRIAFYIHLGRSTHA